MAAHAQTPAVDVTRCSEPEARSPAALAPFVLSYAATVLPVAVREVARWRGRARAIPDPALRAAAQAAMRKRGNTHGAALLALLSPRARRGPVVRALVAIQAAYDYLDTLSEGQSVDPVANGRRLHRALLDALDPHAPPRDYYAGLPAGEAGQTGAGHDDGGYLATMTATARACLGELPSYSAVAPAARAAAGRIVAFQSLNLGVRQGSDEGLARWAREHTPAGSGLRWWETAAAAGSSLGLYSLLALAAHPRCDPRELTRIDRAYFPWIGALHSLLDSLVDVAEDRREGQRNLLSHYASPDEATARLSTIARRAASETRALPRARIHGAILTAMVAHYLASAQASAPGVGALAAGVARAVGAPLRSTLPVSRAARMASRWAPASRARAGGE